MNVKTPIRVLYIDHTAQLGGGEIALRNLLFTLNRESIQPSVLLCASGPLADQLSAFFDVRILPLSKEVATTAKGSLGWRSLLKIRDMFSTASYVWRLSRIIKDLNVDLAHTNSLKSHIIGGFAARLAGVPLIWHMRDRIAADYLPQFAVRIVRLLSKWLPDVVIANSFATMQTISTNMNAEASTPLGRPPRKLRVVHDGCLIPERVTPKTIDDRVKVGLIGRISPWKGQHVFIQAAALLRDRFPTVDFQIVGAALFSESMYESECHELCRRLGLQHRVEFTGFKSDISLALNELHIVVHASTTGEPFGQVIIEAMAAGKPVVATNGGGVPEIVVDGVTGLLVPMGDEQALANAIADLVVDPAKCHAMGDQGRRRAIDCFSIERCARDVERVYEDFFQEPSIASKTTVRLAERKVSTSAVTEPSTSSQHTAERGGRL